MKFSGKIDLIIIYNKITKSHCFKYREVYSTRKSSFIVYGTCARRHARPCMAKYTRVLIERPVGQATAIKSDGVKKLRKETGDESTNER